MRTIDHLKRRYLVKAILSTNDLAYRLGTTAQRLREIAREIEGNRETHYRLKIEISKKNPTKVRHLWVPKPELKAIQSALRRLFQAIPLNSCAHGAVRKRSPRTNASKHLGQQWVVNMDVKDFFPSVRHYVVRDMLRREYGFGRDVAWLITRLVTLRAGLPQGTPTSPLFANLVLTNGVDSSVSSAAGLVGAENTRFLDDVTLSGDGPQSLIGITARALSAKRLKVWRATRKKPKFKIVPNSVRQEVTGLIVNSKSGPSVPREYRDRVRAAVNELQSLHGRESSQSALSIAGRIAYVKQNNPGAARRLQRQFDKIMNG